jgi:hypothetical protein
MYKIKSISEVPVLKSLAFLGIVKKGIYTLWVAYNSTKAEKLSYSEFEEEFLNNDIELQKIDLYNCLSIRLSNNDDALEMLDCFCEFIYQEIHDIKTQLTLQSIEDVCVYKEIMNLVLNNIYKELVTKKLIQL